MKSLEALPVDTEVWNTGLVPLTDQQRLEIDAIRPRVREECLGGGRPCPWVLCRYHLYGEAYKGDFSPRFPNSEVWELKETCALDVADQGACTLQEIAAYMGITRERVRQIERDALVKAGGVFSRGKAVEYLQDILNK